MYGGKAAALPLASTLFLLMLLVAVGANATVSDKGALVEAIVGWPQ